MGKKIRLQTHDGYKNYLEEIEGRPNQYKLVSRCPDFVRSGSTSEGSKFIDLSGGPMIVVGHPLECYGSVKPKVKSILHEKGVGYIITLE